MLAFLLSLSGFKTKTIFGFIIKIYTGRAFLVLFKNLIMSLFGHFVVLAILSKHRWFSDNSNTLANTHITCVKLVCAYEFKVGETFQKLLFRTNFSLYLVFWLTSIHTFLSRNTAAGLPKNDLPQDQGTSEGPETSVLEFWPGASKCAGIHLIEHFSSIFKMNFPKLKIWNVSSHHWMRFNKSLSYIGSVVALLILQDIIFCVSVSDGQSSCN